jgi:GT2 family glycosyltransferase
MDCRTSAAAKPRIAVVVLNWNGKADTLECLASLSEIDYRNFEVVVVDNGSSDDSAAAIRAAFPDATLLETGANLGYAEGNNIGMRAALERGAELVLVLNNDTAVHEGLLRELVDAAASRPDAGIIGAKIYHYGERNRVWYAGARWNRDESKFQMVKDDRGDDGIGLTAETDYACGCAFLVRREVLERVGFFEPRFFLTYEEADLCYRARRNGFAVAYAPRAVVWHKISASMGGEEGPLATYFKSRNYLLWAERNLPKPQSRAVRILALRKLKWALIPEFPGAREWQTLRPSVFARALKQFYKELKSRWVEPTNVAALWGTVHYLLRRFGPAPGYVRSLGKR